MVVAHQRHRTVHLQTVKMANSILCVFYHNTKYFKKVKKFKRRGWDELPFKKVITL